MLKRSNFSRINLILLDAVLVAVSFVLAYYIRFRVLLFLTPVPIPDPEAYLGALVFVVIIWIAILSFVGLYDPMRSDAIDQSASAFAGGALAAVFLVGLLFLYREYWFSRLVLIYAWLLSFALISASRYLIEFVSIYLRKAGFNRKKVVVFGTSDMGRNFVKKISKDRRVGYDIVAYFDDKAGPKNIDGTPVHSDISMIREMAESGSVDVIVLASKEILSADEILDIVSEYESKGVEFKIIPGVLEIMESRVALDAIAGIPLITITRSKLTGANLAVKRAFDIVFASALILILAPLMLFIALTIRINSKGPVFFRQERVGRGGKHFMMFKFRSMVHGAEKMMSPLDCLIEKEGKSYKIKEDPRITAVGKLLRRFSFDELPQLFNVILGDMSIVGPRPQVEQEREKYGCYYDKLMITPGITGLWQASGRAELSFEDRIRLDLYYIENWSLWLDIKIILRTIPAVLSGGGAY